MNFGIVKIVEKAAEKNEKVVKPWQLLETLRNLGMDDETACGKVYEALKIDEAALPAFFAAAALILLRPQYKADIVTKAGKPMRVVPGLAWRANVRPLVPFAIRAALTGEVAAEKPHETLVSLANALYAGTGEDGAKLRETLSGLIAQGGDEKRLEAFRDEIRAYDDAFNADRKPSRHDAGRVVSSAADLDD